MLGEQRETPSRGRTLTPLRRLYQCDPGHADNHGAAAWGTRAVLAAVRGSRGPHHRCGVSADLPVNFGSWTPSAGRGSGATVLNKTVSAAPRTVPTVDRTKKQAAVVRFADRSRPAHAAGQNDAQAPRGTRDAAMVALCRKRVRRQTAPVTALGLGKSFASGRGPAAPQAGASACPLARHGAAMRPEQRARHVRADPGQT
jgi:hypothetical protein